MNNNDLHIFLEILDKADAILKVQDIDYYLISLNDKISVSKYKLILDEMNTHAFFDHLNNLLTSGSDLSDYRMALINKLEEALSLIEFKDGIYTHKRLTLKDTEDSPVSYDEMPEKVKREISGFLEIQRNAIMKFMDLIKNEGYYKVGDKTIHYKPPTITKEMRNRLSEPSPQYPDEILAPGIEWLDIEAVCLMLKISKRTLQSYRDRGILPFSQFGSKFYYNASDIRNILDKNYNVQ
jgi:hypothetical protein